MSRSASVALAFAFLSAAALPALAQQTAPPQGVQMPQPSVQYGQPPQGGMGGPGIAGSGMAEPGMHRMPPPEAIAACSGKAVGQPTSFVGRRGDTIEATCQVSREGHLFARPDWRRDGMGMGGPMGGAVPGAHPPGLPPR